MRDALVSAPSARSSSAWPSRAGARGRTVAQLGGTTTGREMVTAAALLVLRGGGGRQRVKGFEHAFAQRLGARHGSAFWAGRVGLYAVLRALGIGRGDEVVLQVPTHVVVANAIRFCGARPVFVDCDPSTFNIDLAHAESAVTPATRAIVLQHTFGLPATPRAALELARRHGLHLIEDCVHALGSTSGGRPLGSFGDAAFFSLEETKTISTTMGGVVITDDDDLAAALRRIQDECPPPSADRTSRYLAKFVLYGALTHPAVYGVSGALYEAAGRPSPLPRATGQEESRGTRPDGYLCGYSEEQALLGLLQLSRLDRNIAHRRRIADLYARLLPEVGLSGPDVAEGDEPVFVRYPVRVPDAGSAVAGVARVAQLGTWFTSVLEESVSPDRLGYVAGSCPVAEQAVGRLVNLPTHPRVEVADAEAIVAALAAAV